MNDVIYYVKGILMAISFAGIILIGIQLIGHALANVLDDFFNH